MIGKGTSFHVTLSDSTQKSCFIRRPHVFRFPPPGTIGRRPLLIIILEWLGLYTSNLVPLVMKTSKIKRAIFCQSVNLWNNLWFLIWPLPLFNTKTCGISNICKVEQTPILFGYYFAHMKFRDFTDYLRGFRKSPQMAISTISLVIISTTYKHQIYRFRVFRQSLNISVSG